MKDVYRPQPAPLRTALWERLLRSKNGLDAVEAAKLAGCSVPFARKSLRLWSEAGYLVRVEPEAITRDAAAIYRPVKGAPKIAPGITTAGTVVDLRPAMSPEEFAVIRRGLGMTLREFGVALGWTGAATTTSRQMRRFENGDRTIDENLARKIRALKSAEN